MSNTVFQLMQELEHEQIVICNDPHSKLKAIIAIHNTTLGPALGGTRMWNYISDDDAMIDALEQRLHRSSKAENLFAVRWQLV